KLEADWLPCTAAPDSECSSFSKSPPRCQLTPLAVLLSVTRGKVSVPKAVTPSYTREYLAALLRDLFFSYLVFRSCGVPPAVSPVMSSGRCRHLSSGFRSLQRRDVQGQNGRKFENDKK
ncbi:unnamed protein product, partial [Staurois parvus]